MVFEFEYYIKKGIVRKINPDFSRAEFLSLEADKSFIGLKNRIQKIKIDEFNSNSILKDIYDIIMEKIRSKMLKKGYYATGNYAHEAEVSFMKELGFSEYEISFTNELRQARNSITYYGKMFDKDYAKKVYDFLIKIKDSLGLK